MLPALVGSILSITKMIGIPEFTVSSQKLNTRQKLTLLIKFLLVSVVSRILGVIIISISKSMGFALPSEVILNQKKLMSTYSLVVSVALILIILPVMEELAFRGWFSKNRLLTSVSITLFIFYGLYIFFYYVLNQQIQIEKLYTLMIISSLLLLSLIICFKFFLTISQWIEDNYKTLFVISIILFSAIHGLNYKIDQLDSRTFLAILIILLPYPINAYLFTSLRIRAGLIWSLALHILGNSFILIPVLLGREF